MIKMTFIDRLFSLKNKVVILTGASGRLGSHFAQLLSKAGANVVLVDIDDAKSKKLEIMLRRRYGTIPMSIRIDITKPDGVKELKRTVLAKYKKIDVLVNNAQFSPLTHPLQDAPFEQYPLELWNQTIATNLTGLFLCCQEIGNVMVKQNHGIIVNISSIYGVVGVDQRIYGKSGINSPADYAATKGAIVNLTRYLAAHWNRKNIRVNTLTLGGVYDTELHKNNKSFVARYSEKTMIGRMANKEDYDGALLFLASDASPYMTGANLVVDGGWTSW